ncbi:MAG: Nre family DNA repair protein [Candidatus Thermoplasmatota archaeon]|nr:Nre family DNA repair protein [Candidatus Thermoplasmatota archaeon]MBU1915118.1 Nre family DNA repair protein [Candidatus Thermoplasmatota archaeon]
MLCGKERCSVIARFYSASKVRERIDKTTLDGSCPPSVFVGRIGYPDVAIGPMIPPYHGDTSLMDTPERWVGLPIDDIIDFRSNLVRGMHRVDVHDVENTDKLVARTRDLALARNPPEVVAEFQRKPQGRMTVDDDVQPFGPSAPLSKFEVSNFRFDNRLEKAFFDTDLRAGEAVVSLYKDGTLLSQIQRAFSVGAFGVGKRRKFVPTRWSITAVDSNLGLHMLETTKTFQLIDEYRVYETMSLDNRWAILMMPTSWRYELIEAWYPNTAWNPHSDKIAIMSDWEFFDGRTTYASIGGCYYAARLAVNELLQRERRQAGVSIMREAHPGYILPVGVWNVRENVRSALRTSPKRFATLKAALTHISTIMDIPISRWIRNSSILKDALFQRRIDDLWS